jgi:hypothetical protein
MFIYGLRIARAPGAGSVEGSTVSAPRAAAIGTLRRTIVTRQLRRSNLTGA